MSLEPQPLSLKKVFGPKAVPEAAIQILKNRVSYLERTEKKRRTKLDETKALIDAAKQSATEANEADSVTRSNEEAINTFIEQQKQKIRATREERQARVRSLQASLSSTVSVMPRCGQALEVKARSRPSLLPCFYSILLRCTLATTSHACQCSRTLVYLLAPLPSSFSYSIALLSFYTSSRPTPPLLSSPLLPPVSSFAACPTLLFPRLSRLSLSLSVCV